MFKLDVKRCKEFICVGLSLIEGIVAFVSPKLKKKLVQDTTQTEPNSSQQWSN